MNPSCSPPPEGHIKLNSATEIMILSLLCVILKSAAADGWFVRCVAGCRLGLVGARLATCYSDARALYRFLVLLLLSPGCPRCVRALAIARALPSSPTGTGSRLRSRDCFRSTAVVGACPIPWGRRTGMGARVIWP